MIQNGAASDPWAFTVNIPHISTVSPTRGVADTPVTVTGTGFGATQGDSIVYLGTMAASVAPGGWSDTQIQATVDSNAASGVAKVIRGGRSSNSIPFTVPPHWESDNINIYPNLMNILVGESRPLQSVYDNNGAPVSGLAWTTSDPGVASLSTDDPPILTANNPGHVTITAGNASADVTVLAGDSLPLGTIKWSNPGEPAGVSYIVPAVPSATGVADVFAAQKTTYDVQAIRADGTVAWTAPGIDYQWWKPDFQGGVVVINWDDNTIRSYDGITGQPRSAYTFTNLSAYGDFVVHTDGTIFTFDGDKVLLLDAATGIPKTSGITFEHSTWDTEAGRQFDQPADVRSMIVAGDGFAYIAYVYSTSVQTYTPGQSITAHNEKFLKVLRIGTDGSSTKFIAGHWTGDYKYSFDVQRSVLRDETYCDAACVSANLAQAIQVNPACASEYRCDLPMGGTAVCDSDTCTDQGYNISQTGYLPFQAPGPYYSLPQIVSWPRLITNADQGAVVSYSVTVPEYYSNWGDSGVATVPASYSAALLTLRPDGSSNVASISGDQETSLTPAVQRADGTYVGDISRGSYPNESSSLAAFTPAGEILWTVPGSYFPQIATADGGVIAQTGAGTYVTIDQNGRATGQLTMPSQSWLGYTYNEGSVEQSFLIPIDAADNFWDFAGGNPSSNSSAIPRIHVSLSVLNLYRSTPGDIQSDSTVTTKVNNARNFWSAKTNGRLLLDWDGTIQAAKTCDPVAYPNGCGAFPQMDLSDITSAAAANELVRRFCDPTVRPKCLASGVQLVFIGDIEFHGAHAEGLTPSLGPSSNPTFMNISAFSASALDDSSTDDSSNHDLSHELGHVFQLRHIGWSIPSNLMCTGMLPWFFENLNTCPQHAGGHLDTDQIQDSERGARRLQ